MDAEVRKRLAAVTQILSERFEIDPIAPRPFTRDQDLTRIYETEDTATLLERVEVATRKPEPAAPKPEPIKTVPSTRKLGK